MRLATLLFTVPILVGCAPPADLPTGGVVVSHTSGDGTCDAGPAQEFVGQTASDKLGFPILQASGAEELRWGGPDTAFTMDYRVTRVNVIYNAKGIITRVYCG